MLDSLSKNEKRMMRSQTEPGVVGDLQMVLDAHIEELIGGSDDDDDAEPLFTNSFVDGFRYFIHSPNELPHLSEENYATPNTVSYTKIAMNRFDRICLDGWGKCNEVYPKQFQPTNSTYSTRKCFEMCKAQYFFEKCKFAPACYNFEQEHKDCSPFEIRQCVAKNAQFFDINSKCSMCQKKCHDVVYETSIKWQSDISKSGLNEIRKTNSTWKFDYMRRNFQILHNYFEKMSFSHHTEILDESIENLFVEICGYLGLALGISFFSILEVFEFLLKVLSIFVQMAFNFLIKKMGNGARGSRRNMNENSNQQISE